VRRLSGRRSPTAGVQILAAPRQSLTDAGYIDGRNVVIQSHWAEGQYDRLPTMASEMVRRQVAVIISPNWGRSNLGCCGSWSLPRGELGCWSTRTTQLPRSVERHSGISFSYGRDNCIGSCTET
jgi:hypothetical protein